MACVIITLRPRKNWTWAVGKRFPNLSRSKIRLVHATGEEKKAIMKVVGSAYPPTFNSLKHDMAIWLHSSAQGAYDEFRRAQTEKRS